MPTDTLKRFREEALKLGGTERTKRRGELLGKIREDAVAVIALASETAIALEKKKSLEQLLEEIRAAAEGMRAETEATITGALALADTAAGVWEEMWEAALGDPAMSRTKETEILRWVLEDAGRLLREGLLWAQRLAHLVARPLARLDELESRAAEFPLWARECLARWKMLGRPAPPLDPERIARAQAAYARGEHEAVDDVLSRVQAGGPWVKE
jgi:hypothetical protein